MEAARLGGQAQQLFYGLGSASTAKRSLDWDLNDWKWDQDLFLATPLLNSTNPLNIYHDNQSRQLQFFPLETGLPVASSNTNSSSSCSDELLNHRLRGVDNVNQNEKDKHTRGFEKRRTRTTVAEDDDYLEDEASASLALKLGNGRVHCTPEREVANWDKTSGKKTKVTGTASTRAVCQVEDCGADLTKAKDYHRRHKVCETHSKASRALIANVMQRFCQQCSRFHAIQEFDEGKRSCRRRLAGHNKRRRKTQPDPAANESSLNDSQTSGYLLMSILKILSHMHSSKTNQADDRDLLSHLLTSPVEHSALHGDEDLSGLLQRPREDIAHFLNNGAEMVTALLANGAQGLPIPEQRNCTIPAAEVPKNVLHTYDVRVEDLPTSSSQGLGLKFPSQANSVAYVQGNGNPTENSKLINFDLNDAYIDVNDGIEDLESSPVPDDLGASNLDCPSWTQQDSHQSSPPQMSGNSDSASAQSPSSSSGDAKTRTDRIVFKLFGKEPSDFPFALRAQILDWLSHSPTDIESYIRPGCIVLTIYLHISESAWEELSHNLGSSFSRLLDVSDDSSFWMTGWIYIRVQNRIVFIYNGIIVVDTSLPFKSTYCSTILSVKPIAVPLSERAEFTITGFNLSGPSTRILCALQGSYVLLEANSHSIEHVDRTEEHDELQSLNFSCSAPAVTGRGFLEIDDLSLSSSFFPFIVAEKDVCSEIRMLESEIELTETDCFDRKTGKAETRRILAMNFIHEFGWLLQRSHLKSRLGHLDPNSYLFAFKRFKWLIKFSANQGWCAVVKKLLDILLDGNIGAGEQPFLKSALFEMGLLHRAVRRNSRPLVELLLRYVPEKVANELSLEYTCLVAGERRSLFRPDAVGPAGLTPLHVAAGTDGSEDVLNALTDDPREVAIKAWKNAYDSTGFTPEDYARLRGHYTYIHLVQSKIHKKVSAGHVVVDIPIAASSGNMTQKQQEVSTASFEIVRSRIGLIKQPCRLCDRKLAHGGGNGSLLYRPAMLSMVAIAAVCVCVALLFKSSPEVLFVFRPFRWETLDYGCS